MKTIYVNGKMIQTTALDLTELFSSLQFDQESIATAIDGQFIPKTQYAQTFIQAGQKIEVLAPMQGG